MPGAFQSSRLYTWFVAGRRRIARAVEHSTVARVANAGSRLYDRAVPHSRSRTAFHTVARWVRASGVYAWLSDGPKPPAIDIDLRASKTLGAVLPALTRLYRTASPTRQADAGPNDDGSPVSIGQFVGVLFVTVVLASTATAAVTGGVSTRGLLLRLWFLVVGLVALRVGTRRR